MKKDPICNMEVNEDEAIRTEYDGETYYFCSEGCREKFLKEKADKPLRRCYDLIIVGGGPAGLTAAVYAATLKIHAFLITKDLGGQAIDSTKIENYMGYDFVTGPELIQKFKYQVIHSHYIDHSMSEVERIKPDKDGFKVVTSELNKYYASTLILATGMTRRRLNVPGEEKFQRKGIFYGNIQDWSFVQDSDVAVIGGGNSALQIVENLHTVAKKIYLVSDSKLTADPVIIERINKMENLSKFENFKVTEFAGEDTLTKVIIRKKAEEGMTNLRVKGIFIAIGLQPNSSLVSHMVKHNDRGEINVNPDCSTSYPGIFAAGDVTDAFGKRIIIASGEGAKAAMAARKYILSRQKKGVQS
jgi:alkyl hydroperoxide reductase subunit F